MPIDIGDIPTGTPPTTGEKLQIRTAIGLGQTDAPTFLTAALSSQGLANAPSLAIGTGAGYYQPTNTQISFSANGSEAIRFTGGGIRLGTNELGWGTFAINSLILARDADGILAQRNGTNAQAFRVYNTDPVGGAKEWGGLAWSGNEFRVESAATGGGSIKRTILGGSDIVFVASSGARWQITSTALLAFADNTYDIGASGANRPRDIYAAGTINSGSNVNGSGIINALGLTFQGRGSLSSQGNGILKMSDNTTSDFSRLQLGSTTDASPAIARDGAGIKFTGAAAGSTSWIKVPAVAVSALPSAATAGVGARAFVNNALNPVFGNAVVGSGLSTVPVYSDGTNWNVG
jgi:hypothetical protein